MMKYVIRSFSKDALEKKTVNEPAAYCILVIICGVPVGDIYVT